MPAGKAYGKFFNNLCNGNIPWKATDGANFKVALLSSDYTPNQDLHEVWADVSANEVVGSGYLTGGAAVTTIDPSYDAGSNTLKLDLSDATWENVTLTARYAVVYMTGTTNYLVAYLDFGSNKMPSAEPFTVKFGAEGVVKIVIA